MANIKPDYRETRPQIVRGRSDSWLRRNDAKFLRVVRKVEKREGQRKIRIEKMVK